jgi:hypothetical protein
MDEFARNLSIFSIPRMIHHDMDFSLLEQQLHQMKREDLLKLWTELRVAERFRETLLGASGGRARYYKGVDPKRYGGVSAPEQEVNSRHDEI